MWVVDWSRVLDLLRGNKPSTPKERQEIKLSRPDNVRLGAKLYKPPNGNWRIRPKAMRVFRPR